MRIRVELLEEDIRKGCNIPKNKSLTENCPVARALRRTFHTRATEAAAWQGAAEVKGERFSLPNRANSFIDRFDGYPKSERLLMKPLVFHVNVSDKLGRRVAA